LSSGENGSQIIPNSEFKTITVRDFPENIAVMERALVRLDLPEQTPVNFEIQLHLIVTSRTAMEKTNLPVGLESVINQLKNTLQYTGYRYITTFLSRAKDGGSIAASGSTVPLYPVPVSYVKTNYNYKLDGISLLRGNDVSEVIQVRALFFSLRSPVVIGTKNEIPQIEYKESKITTGLNLREGEMVVVGSTDFGVPDEALILVVSVKKVK
ncbi:MAG: hypothetical protein AB1489_27780, partial [Acidobacteriota bacterium]